MTKFPVDQTYESENPVCPNCGYEFDTSEGNYYPRRGLEDEYTEKCPGCDMELVIYAELKPTWSIVHPQQCDIKGYHIVYTNYDKHECLYCHKPLNCDCIQLEQCSHNLEELTT